MLDFVGEVRRRGQKGHGAYNLSMIRPFDVLGVNGHPINADGEVTAERATE